MAVKNAAALLDEFRRLGIAVEVTHRSARRLFGLAPLRDGVAPPRRPVPRRGRGWPPLLREDAAPPPPPPWPVELQGFDHTELETWMAHADQAIRNARRSLDRIVPAGPPDQQES